MKKNYHGFTLIEMMIVIAILGIVLAMAIPSFTDMLNRKRVEAAANEFLSTFSLAKSEAVKRNAQIFLLATKNADGSSWNVMASTTSTCATSACNLKQIGSGNFKNVKTLFLSTALNQSTVDPVRMLPVFNGGTTSTQCIKFAGGEDDRYQLNARITVTGLSKICDASASGYKLGAYPSCTSTEKGECA